MAHWVIDRLGLTPLPAEGGWFRETYRDAHSTAIYFFLRRGETSAFHRLTSAEVYHWYAGSPCRLDRLHPDGTHDAVRLGGDLEAGELPQAVVAAGVWQACEPLGEWVLLGTTVAPPFEWTGFELGDPAELAERWSLARDRIVAVNRQ